MYYNIMMPNMIPHVQLPINIINYYLKIDFTKKNYDYI